MSAETDGEASTSTLGLRVAYLLATHGRTLTIGLLLLSAALIGGAGWLYTHPETEDFQRQTHVQTVRVTASTSALVTGESSLYDRGTRLRGKTIYFLDTTPELRLTQRVHVPTGTSVTQRLVLRYTAAHEGTVFWSRNRTLTTATVTSKERPLTLRTTLDMPRIKQQIQTYQQEVGSGATVSVRVLSIVRYDTGRYTGTLRQPVSLTFGPEWYEVTAAPVSRTHARTVTTVRVTSRRHAVLVGIAGGVVLLLAPFAYAFARQLRPRHELLRRRLARAQFSDWISQGDVRNAMTDRRVGLDSLGALVDVAVDIDGRIIYDPDRGVYAVFDDEITYLVEELESPGGVSRDGSTGPDASDSETDSDDSQFEFPVSEE